MAPNGHQRAKCRAGNSVGDEEENCPSHKPSEQRLAPASHECGCCYAQHLLKISATQKPISDGFGQCFNNRNHSWTQKALWRSMAGNNNPLIQPIMTPLATSKGTKEETRTLRIRNSIIVEVSETSNSGVNFRKNNAEMYAPYSPRQRSLVWFNINEIRLSEN